VIGIWCSASLFIWQANSAARSCEPLQPHAPLSGQPLPQKGPKAAWWIGW
jgi:hypothetical protein